MKYVLLITSVFKTLTVHCQDSRTYSTTRKKHKTTQCFNHVISLRLFDDYVIMSKRYTYTRIHDTSRFENDLNRIGKKKNPRPGRGGGGPTACPTLLCCASEYVVTLTEQRSDRARKQKQNEPTRTNMAN